VLGHPANTKSLHGKLMFESFAAPNFE